jgi:Tol biopolymer transport system component
MTNDVDLESLSSSASDGARIYFSQLHNGSPELSEALTSNGEIRQLHLPSEISVPLIGGLSPDGANLVLRSYSQSALEQPLWIVPTFGSDARRVPNILGHDATWMPDGKRLLVANGNALLVVNTDGSDAHPFMSLPGRAFWMRWSPNGKRLRFTLRDSAQQVIAIWEADARGANPHPLLPGWSRPSAECCGSWTADGTYFVFQSWHSGHSEIWAQRERPWFRRSSEPYAITAGPLSYEAPTTAPGSHQVDFIGADVRIQLLRALPSSSAFLPLEENLSTAAFASYSHDGQWVAWLNASDGSLWRSRLDGTERIELTTPPLRIFSMRWSPDDARLALMAEEPGKPWKVYVIDADGGKPVPVLDEARNQADPDWASNSALVFGRPPDRMDGVGPKSIYLLDLTTHQLSEIPGSRGLFSPRLSPDGRSIAAITLDQHKLLLFDRNARRWTTLTTHNVGDPTWSQDSRSVYFQDFLEPGKPIYRIAVQSGRVEQVANIRSLSPIPAADYRLIGLAPGDLPIVSARTPTVNIFTADLDK